METTASQKAISLALNGNWEEAIKANLEILKESPDDVDALNRLARAYAETGNIAKAQASAQKVLKIDPVNPIAQKCLERWKSAKNTEKHFTGTFNSESFLEEPGKTKLVQLVNPGDSKILATLDSGEEVSLITHTHKVSVITSSGKYIGRISDDLANRLKKLVKSGFKYQVLIKSVDSKDVTVFIREIEKPKDSPHSQSFPVEKIDYVSFTPPELVHKEAPVNETPEEEI